VLCISFERNDDKEIDRSIERRR